MSAWKEYGYTTPSGRKRRKRQTSKIGNWLDVVTGYLSKPASNDIRELWTVKEEIDENPFEVQAEFVAELINEELVPITENLLFTMMYENEYNLVMNKVVAIYDQLWIDLKKREWILTGNCSMNGSASAIAQYNKIVLAQYGAFAIYDLEVYLEACPPQTKREFYEIVAKAIKLEVKPDQDNTDIDNYVEDLFVVFREKMSKKNLFERNEGFGKLMARSF